MEKTLFLCLPQRQLKNNLFAFLERESGSFESLILSLCLLAELYMELIIYDCHLESSTENNDFHTISS